MSNENIVLRRIFSDTCKGVSAAKYGSTPCFVKHFSHHDQVDFDVLYQDFLSEALQMGVPNEKERLEFLKDSGIWSEQEETSISNTQSELTRLVSEKEQIVLVSKIKEQDRKIRDAERRLNELQNRKYSLIGTTAESFANDKVNEEYVLRSFFKDQACTLPLISLEDLEESESNVIKTLTEIYNNVFSIFSEINIKKLCLQDFFYMYWFSANDDVYNFYGRPICNLTYLQIRLLNNAKIFGPILPKLNTVPENIRDDPDKILDYIRAGEKSRAILEKNASKNEGAATSIVGAKKQDYEAAGFDSSNSVSLSKMLKQKQKEGKSGLTMHDLMAIA